jgi:hypothetical protein
MSLQARLVSRLIFEAEKYFTKFTHFLHEHEGFRVLKNKKVFL